MAEVTFRTSRGTRPDEHIARLRAALKPAREDLQYAGERQRTRQLDRTRHGLDVDGRPFAPYSTNGPYYYNPSAGRGGAFFSPKQAERVYSGKTTFQRLDSQNRRAAVRRMFAKLGGHGRATHSDVVHRGTRQAGSGEMRISRTGRSIRFESYAAFKRWLGRAYVDLTGPRAPHMLQGILVAARSAAEMVMGVYGAAAARAQGHNEGGRRLPKRRFFAASGADLAAMVGDIGKRVMARLKGL